MCDHLETQGARRTHTPGGHWQALCGVLIIGAGASEPRPELLIPDVVREPFKNVLADFVR